MLHTLKWNYSSESVLDDLRCAEFQDPEGCKRKTRDVYGYFELKHFHSEMTTSNIVENMFSHLYFVGP